MDILYSTAARLKPGQRIEVVNLDTGEVMEDVTEFDAEGGYLLRFRKDETGRVIVSSDGSRIVLEAVLGRFVGREIV
jgi:hypothetical protein